MRLNTVSKPDDIIVPFVHCRFARCLCFSVTVLVFSSQSGLATEAGTSILSDISEPFPGSEPDVHVLL